ncbi:bifunctional diaminohydroxyphosphoribosylaminopyrimidine deaminase/5-amino-6-(5-phosphoribosylamino)uracil reductase RibD [Aquabacterium sp. A7-Y]|uniref:bifunctional diaminohydroxyphosphoribosylaminopyrimidine deaminase/5-amino-6-(5-phosphoribosylamino)uracil reductase RibD n=1 Tax=Aquabacterium sp. A7-Y TaxID=1349605 RepID=UPI00223E1A83|nr:bifunctional diaminohydroxyphosphoribosylaminopyrimidine deaminase/5-amino-6-(5-phosphoribosylamino)uracil reductase RibD [Aquabacterium sp. A7-Y]MCW7539171.1 bifunctional diaminohydroxyphosphoribosylaminopyrimidine deaminase/5-amino-6-(5-phosphoribosylamino)uracil reductase RibD [Aquabacterium sp. A7-Y]
MPAPLDALMQRALDLAALAKPIASPNPSVGCVLLSSEGAVIGEGHTQAAGSDHAEISAMKDARARGHTLSGATAVVTLEPCAHHGRTGPCADALIRAGVKRVVAALEDPFPAVAGAGFARLRNAGVEVQVGLLAEPAREMNLGFFSRIQRGRPWVRVKIAASLDGRTALDNGISQWITSPEAREDGQRFRAQACAILTGSGTVQADDPRLDVRLAGAARQPLRVVLDSELTLRPDARIVAPPGRLRVYTASDERAKIDALAEAGVEIVPLPGPDGRVDLPATLQHLARSGTGDLHVEAGPTLAGALVAHGLADEFLVYLAPKLLGRGRDMLQWGPLETLAQGVSLRLLDTRPVGPDLRILARVEGHDRF